jgi:hypothetical protein
MTIICGVTGAINIVPDERNMHDPGHANPSSIVDFDSRESFEDDRLPDLA